MPFEKLRSAIQPGRERLLAHPIYHDLQSAAALRTFMEYHVFAVWDFMSLLKALQQRLSCVAVPWLPVAWSTGGRLINEIVLAEETDEDGRGGYASHFDLYRQAMIAFGASTRRIDALLERLGAGQSVRQAMQAGELPQPIQDFVGHTFAVIESGDLSRLAASFTFGREDLLPAVFERIVSELASGDGHLHGFHYYLQRHVALDGDHHGPMATRLVESLCGDDPTKWQAATDAATQALDARLRLWNAIHQAVLQ